MSSDIYRQIHESMDLRETNDLLSIWKQNDHVAWSDEAFSAIQDVLKSRGVDLPAQNDAVYEHNADGEIEDGTYGFTELELKIIDDENPPEFYDPLEALKVRKLIDLAAIVSIGVSILLGIIELPRSQNVVLSYFSGNPAWRVPAFLIAAFIVLVGIVLQILITYFPLRALAHILGILMEMEFNSRKAAEPHPAMTGD